MRSWRKIGAVGRFEFECTVRSKSWLIITFGMPLFLLIYAGFFSVPAYLSAMKEKQVTVYGVVDEAGVLGMSRDVEQPAVEISDEVRSALRTAGQQQALEHAMAFSQNVVFRPFETDGAARQALKDGDTKGYFRIPPDYLETGLVETYTSERGTDLGSASSRRALSSVLQGRLLEGKVPPALAERVLKPIAQSRAWTITETGALKKTGGAGKIVKVLVPLGFGILLLLSILMSAGALVQATAIEKENKVVEVILASAKPDEMLLGKLLGLGTAGVIQMMVWFGMVAVSGVALMGTLAALGVDLPWVGIVAAVGFFPLAYLFFGSLMLGTGSLGSNQREASQWGMMWTLPAVVPMFFFEILLREPHGFLARLLTWIPFTAPMTAVFRLTVDPEGVAWWEVLGPIVLMVGAIRLAIGLAARLFRVGIVLTGARPKLREILRQARLS